MLAKCLAGIAAQERLPDEIVICLRDHDEASQQFVKEAQWRALPIIVAISTETGVVAAMNAGLRVSTGAIVALLDDDAVPYPDWLERVHRYFTEQPELLGVGGVDLQTNPDHKSHSSRPPRVGIFTWYGRLLGNHHLGRGEPQCVQVLKGCNCAYRGEFLRSVGIEPALRGKGAQVGWEIALGLHVIQRRGRMIYDPAIRVDHLIAPRHDLDNIHRGVYNPQAAYDIAWNQFYIVRRYAAWPLKLRVVGWELLVGSKTNPGVLRLGDLRVSTSERISRIRNTFRAFDASSRAVAPNRMQTSL